MITDREIIKQLKEREAVLLHQIEKVRLALSAFSDDLVSEASAPSTLARVDNAQKEYDQFLSYEQKVVLALTTIKQGYIDNIRDFLIDAGDEMDASRLFKGLTAAASKLYNKNILKADTRGRKYKYYLNPETEKERAEILPLFE